jgi:hypothetical protein
MYGRGKFPLLVEVNQEKKENFFHFKDTSNSIKFKKICKNRMLLIK